MVQRQLRVVEMLIDGRWYPTAGAAVEGGAWARKILREWREKNPDDKFRLRIYRPERG